MAHSVAIWRNRENMVDGTGEQTVVAVPDPERTANRQLSIVLFLLTLTLYSFFLQEAGWNQSTRMALILSATQYGDITIDRYEKLTGDKAQYDGHYYSDKAPGTALLGIPAFELFLRLQHLDRYSIIRDGTDASPTLAYSIRYPTYLVTVATVALPSAILTVLLFLLLLQMSHRRVWAFTLTLFYALGTMAFPFSMMMFGHQSAAVFAFAAFYVLVQARFRQKAALLLLLAGALSGIAVLMDFPSAIIVIMLFLYAISVVRAKIHLAFYILGGAPSVIILGVINWLSVGNPTRFAYSFEADPYFAQSMQQGALGVTLPHWGSLVELLLGSRGLLTQSFFFWLLPFAVWQMYRVKTWRREGFVCVGVGVLYLLGNSSYYLPLGGQVSGPRFLIPALPFLIVPLIFLVHVPRPFSKLVQPALVISGAVSIAYMFVISCVQPQVPEQVQNPLGQVWLSNFSQGSLMLNLGMLRFGLSGLRSLAPLALFTLIAVDTLLLVILGRGQVTHRSRMFRLGLLVVLYLVIAFPINLIHPSQVPPFFLAR